MTSQDASVPGRKPTSNPGAPVAAMLLPFLLSMLSPVALAPITVAQVSETGTAPEDIWSTEYAQQIFPWGPHGDEAQLQFIEK